MKSFWQKAEFMRNCIICIRYKKIYSDPEKRINERDAAVYRKVIRIKIKQGIDCI